MPAESDAKDPGRVHCYRDVCHRVRSLEETRRLIGRTLQLEASYYDDASVDRFNRGTVTSNGETFDAGSPGRVSSSDLPDGTELLLRNPANGLTSHVRVNDFGPFYGSRLIDVTRRVARDLGFVRKGVTPLEVTIIAAPMPEEATYRRNRISQPTLGHIGVVEASELTTLVRRLVSIDRRLALQARRSNLPEIAGHLTPLPPDRALAIAALPPGPATPSAPEDPESHATLGIGTDAIDIAALDDDRAARETIFAADVADLVTTAIAGADPATPVAAQSGTERRVLIAARPTDVAMQTADDPGPLTPAVFEARFAGSSAMLMSLVLAAFASLVLYGTFVWRTGGGAPRPVSRHASRHGRANNMQTRVASSLDIETPGSRTRERAPSAGPVSMDEPSTSGLPAQAAHVSYIGTEITITGRIIARGAVAIAGEVLGDVIAKEVEIVEGGRVLGHIEASRLVVAGTLRGTARADVVHAAATACLFADLEYETLAAHPASFIDGTLRPLRRTQPAAAQIPAQLAS